MQLLLKMQLLIKMQLLLKMVLKVSFLTKVAFLSKAPKKNSAILAISDIIISLFWQSCVFKSHRDYAMGRAHVKLKRKALM